MSLNLQKLIMDVYLTLTEDEEMLRLLNYSNNPLSPTLPNIKDLPIREMNDIIDNHIIRSDVTDNLESSPIITRLCFYPGRLRPTNNTALVSQDIHFDIYVANNQDARDLRMVVLIDHINTLISKNRITGVSKVELIDAFNIINRPRGYVGHKLVYRCVKKK